MTRVATLLVTVTLFVLSACSDDAAIPSLSTQLTSASTYLAAALPDFGNTVGSRQRAAVGRTTNFITPAVWSSTTTGDLIAPPGGEVSSPATEPTYGGATLPALVNYRDFMKMALDSEFRRKNSSGTFRPTVYGRFDNLLQVQTYMTQAGIATDASGMPAVGVYNVSLSIDGTTYNIYAEVTAATDTTHYDRRLYVFGYSDANANGTWDASETKVFENLMWMRSSATQLNFMMAELGDRNSDSTKDTISLSVLRWNISTGSFQFEYVSNSDDSIPNGNLEMFRAHVEGTNGKSYLYGWQGKGDSTAVPGDYVQYALYAPTPGTELGTVSLRQVRSDSNIWLGNLCSTFTTGAGAVGDTTDEAEPASGGTCVGQAADSINTKAGILGFAFDLRADTVWTTTAGDKGFPAVANPDWSTAERRAAWLAAGDAISVSFSDRTGFIAAWDPTP